MLYELRIYHVLPGKMEQLHRRFADHTMQIFARLDMTVTEFWQDIEHDRLYYVMEFADRDTRDRKFEQFRDDPKWQSVKAESEKDGPLVEKIESVFLQQVPYAPRS